jgi:hypothetical protein
MSYYARLSACKPLDAVMILLYLGAVLAPALGHKPMIALAVAAAGLLGYIRLRCRSISFTEATFTYKGWFKHYEIPYEAVLKVRTPDHLNWPHDRFHGSCEYKVSTQSKNFWLSLLWFPAEASVLFRDKVLHGKNQTAL